VPQAGERCRLRSWRRRESKLVAVRALSNVGFLYACVADALLENEWIDFGFGIQRSPDVAAGIASCIAKLKHGTWVLVYGARLLKIVPGSVLGSAFGESGAPADARRWE
jgi:hypothetical protein